MTLMTNPQQRNVRIVGGPHDGLTASIPRTATSVVMFCWDGKPVIMKPAKGPRRLESVYTQRGDDRHALVYRADSKIEVHD